ncbi:MAG: hypothetical protein WAX14_03390 [Rhodococcus sp. (in: high G+C Gram-positive bacteria)]|uniref:hypothetical protein n=1 Tax=Rhodococcus sp. TaxID=1831 RepID=UPI003BB6BB8C
MSASTRPSTWAKSPSFADQPDRVEAIATQTAIDKINYLDSGLSEVACHSCGTCVLVRKNSFRQTSVQWQSDPNVTCPVFRDTDRSDTPREGCPNLRASIAQAVVDGSLPVPR